MGMMNNSSFRTKVHQVQHPTTGMPALQFQHPTQAGPGNFGGWFEEKSMGSADAPKVPPNPNPNPDPNPNPNPNPNP